MVRSGALWDALGALWDTLGRSETHWCPLGRSGTICDALSLGPSGTIWALWGICFRENCSSEKCFLFLSFSYRGSVFVFIVVFIAMERLQMGFCIMDGICGVWMGFVALWLYTLWDALERSGTP